MNEPFSITDCALVVLATGEKAHNLRELLDRLNRLDDPDLMYFHFWAGLLRPHFLDPEYPNDFGAWAYHSLHDRILAERLSIINPADFDSLEEVRFRVIEIVEDRMEEDSFSASKEAEYPFFFQRSQIVVFDTHLRIQHPRELVSVIPKMTFESVFYHLIDARRRTHSNLNDFSEWLKGWGAPYDQLGDKIASIDPFFATLMDLRKALKRTTGEFMKNEEVV
jgi:hypothetical protein